MLSGFEALLVALVADRLADRPGLAVTQAGGAPAVPAAGNGLVQIGVSAAAPDGLRGFARDDQLHPITDATQQRAVPLRADVTATLARRATGAADDALHVARATLLEDLTLLVHALDDQDVRTGTALRPAAADPGFQVRELALTGVTVPAAAAGDQAQATASYGARLVVWPPGQATATGLVLAVDALVEAQPLRLAVAPAMVATGGSARVTVAGITGTRLADRQTGAREPVRIAVGVGSELPPGDRGTVTGGEPASRAGFRVFPVTDLETAVAYTAPTGPLGTVRSEELLVHLATSGAGAAPDVGVRLGSVTVGLRPDS